MGTIGPIIASGAGLAPMYAERLLKEIPPHDFARFARPGGALVTSNHPAFVYGHLALYPAKVLERLGQPPGAAAARPEWEAVFKNGVECQDDPQGTIYPPMDVITGWFFAGYKLALGAVAAAPDELLAGPNPAEGRMRELFPTLGAMLIFYLDGHVQSHLGQVSAWRRMMGLPPA